MNKKVNDYLHLDYDLCDQIPYTISPENASYQNMFSMFEMYLFVVLFFNPFLKYKNC